MSALPQKGSANSSLEGEFQYWQTNTQVDDEIYKPSISWGLRVSKRAADIFGALFFFLSLGWLYLIVWFCVIVTSSRPGIYSQSRYGRGGRLFRFYKFRSMVSNASQVLEDHLEENPVARQQWADFQKLEDDPRVTWFGAFIRKTSLDELPQFWNVLIGDMSLVGPRPCMVDQKQLYEENWKYYCAVRPGITGLWQVSGRNELNYKQRVELDMQYVKNISVKGDIFIFLKTLWVVLSGHGSR